MSDDSGSEGCSSDTDDDVGRRTGYCGGLMSSGSMSFG